MQRRVLLVLLVVLVAGTAWFFFAPRRALVELRDLNRARVLFNESPDAVRVIALLSPT